jgi:basic membrane protein A
MSPTPLLRRPALTAAAAAMALFALTACGNNATDSNDSNDSAGSGGDASGTPGENGGTIPEGEPDVNGDGKVVIGVLSPGDLNDNGFYESFVVKAQEVVDDNGWELIKVGSINPADALEQARNLCRQGVDMVALAASELADAIPASEEDVCADTAWYVPSSAGSIEVSDRITLSADFINESLLAAGYAMGLLMEDSGATKAGFVTGPEADFSIAAAAAYQAGIRELIPDAEVISTYTGDFNDSALAVEATTAQLNQGVASLYPYLGGATDAAAQVAFDADIPVATPGTDRCSENTFAVSVVFDPGEYFGAALQDFADGKLAMGAVREWHLGLDPVPTVILCNATAEQEKKLTEFITSVGDGTIDADAVVERNGS